MIVSEVSTAQIYEFVKILQHCFTILKNKWQNWPDFKTSPFSGLAGLACSYVPVWKPYFSGNYGAAPTTTKRPPKCIDENKNGVCDIDEEKKDEMEEDYDESDEQKADINEVMDYTNQVCHQISRRMCQ